MWCQVQVTSYRRMIMRRIKIHILFVLIKKSAVYFTCLSRFWQLLKRINVCVAVADNNNKYISQSLYWILSFNYSLISRQFSTEFNRKNCSHNVKLTNNLINEFQFRTHNFDLNKIKIKKEKKSLELWELSAVNYAKFSFPDRFTRNILFLLVDKQ